MSSNYPKRKTFHIVARDVDTKKVLACTRLKVTMTYEAQDEFERLCRQAQRAGAFDGPTRHLLTGKWVGPLRIELYVGPPSARQNGRLIAMAGNFKPSTMVEEFGNLSYLDLINAAHADRAHLTQRWSDTFIVEKHPVADPLNGKSVLELDPRNARFYGEVLNSMPVGKLTEEEYQARKAQLLAVPSMGTSSVRQQLLGGHVSQTPEGEVDPAPKRPGPIRIMGEAEGIIGIPAPRLSDDVVSALMDMSEPNPIQKA